MRSALLLALIALAVHPQEVSQSGLRLKAERASQIGVNIMKYGAAAVDAAAASLPRYPAHWRAGVFNANSHFQNDRR